MKIPNKVDRELKAPKKKQYVLWAFQHLNDYMEGSPTKHRSPSGNVIRGSVCSFVFGSKCSIQN